MPRDYANIYNLPEHEREAEKKDLWGNCVPTSKEQATLLARKIKSIEPPYVLSLEAEYGMGKTYFATRFCEYLKCHGIDCVYISAWEQDYQPSPFCFIVKEILDYLEKKRKPVVQSELNNLSKKGTEAVGKILAACHFQLGIQTSIVSAGVDLDVEKLYKSFITPKDELKEFKKELEKILHLSKIDRLVVIIDELDRCRPDYALKTLEIIKHFFDIDNLIVVLPINKSALKQAVKSTYGEIEENNENYLRKLITEEMSLQAPTVESYTKIADTNILEKKLKNIIKRKSIEKNGTYNGFNLISKCIGKYALAGKLTYRETVKVCDEFINIVELIKSKIHIEYLVYKLCQKHSKFTIELSKKHPFYKSTNPFRDGYDRRYSILTIDGLYAHVHGLSSYINNNIFCKDYTGIDKWERSDHFETYEELNEYIRQIKTNKDDLLKEPLNMQAKEQLNWLFDAVAKKEKEMNEYQEKYGSDDKDNEVKSFYDNIINDPLSMYNME